MSTAVSDSNQQGHKVASIQNPAPVAPSYVTIPGIQGPVSIIQANPNQPGVMQQGQVASALPPGMIQLASPLAFNILPGGRIQVIICVLELCIIPDSDMPSWNMTWLGHNFYSMLLSIPSHVA